MSKDLTVRQIEIANFICSESEKLGSGIGYRQIGKHFGVAINAVKNHIEAIKAKTGQSLITWTSDENGRAKANSLRSPKLESGFADTSISPNCRSGNGFSVVVVGNDVAFTIFSDSGIIRHDKISLSEALGYCDTFSVNGDSNIDRIAKLAEKQAVKATKMTAKV